LNYGPVLFEWLGLWVGEGTKGKGLYFGNTSEELLLHFLKYTEEILEFPRENFKVTIVLPKSVENLEEVKKKWSEILKIPLENFTNVSIKKNGPKQNFEYVQLYFNSIIMFELMRSLQEKLKPVVLENKEFTISFLRGIFSGEGSVVLKPNGTLFHVSISNKNEKLVEFIRTLLNNLEIQTGKYLYYHGMKFPIYGRKNFEKLKQYRILELSKEKNEKFLMGLNSYQRNVEKPEEVERKILEQLLFSPMGYTELSQKLKKGRSTIQSTYIPKMLEKELVRYIGKKGRSLLFEITEKGKEYLNTLQVLSHK
jgi:hypothetical protein